MAVRAFRLRRSLITTTPWLRGLERGDLKEAFHQLPELEKKVEADLREGKLDPAFGEEG
jgi:hypothetical protein